MTYPIPIKYTLKLLSILYLALTSLYLQAGNTTKQLTDDDIAKLIIQDSINHYPKQCACPYSLMKNGRLCGGRSAYSKPGGASPLCYRVDVTAEAIKQWRSSH
ncbi:MAG: hypothetical protein JWQ09_5783 [Segetibacter sp.]|nr:hypothetical protein [Segetibacter sp.]